jgi:excisionase family DNA binding protein
MKLIEPVNDEVMDYKGLSVYLKYSQGTLRQKVMNSEIPFYKIGTAVRFSKKKIDAWLEEHKRETNKNHYAKNIELFTPDGGGE